MSGTRSQQLQLEGIINEDAGFAQKPRSSGSVSCEETGIAFRFFLFRSSVELLRTCSVMTLGQTANQNGMHDNKDTLKAKSNVVNRHKPNLHCFPICSKVLSNTH